MPHTEVKAVVALADRARAVAPIAEVIAGVGRAVFVVTQRRVGAVLETAPRRAVALMKFGGIAVFVGQVAGGKNLARDFLDELGGSFGSGKSGTASGYVARADKR